MKKIRIHCGRCNVFFFLKTRKNSFDIIIKPPTFSNSKKMEGNSGYQRDYVELINDCMAIFCRRKVFF